MGKRTGKRLAHALFSKKEVEFDEGAIRRGVPLLLNIVIHQPLHIIYLKHTKSLTDLP